MEKKIFYKKRKYNIVCIAPARGLVSRTFKAIEYIKKIDSNYFNQVKNNLQNIFIIDGKGYLNAYFIEDGIWFSLSGGIKDNHLIYLASLLIHESQHMVQARSSKKYFGARAEKDAYLVQRDFLKKIPNKKLREWFIDWLDKQFSKKWWVTFGKKIEKENNIFEKALKEHKEKMIKIINY